MFDFLVSLMKMSRVLNNSPQGCKMAWPRMRKKRQDIIRQETTRENIMGKDAAKQDKARRGREAKRQTDRQTDGQAGRQTGRQADGQADRAKQAGKQTEPGTDTHTHTDRQGCMAMVQEWAEQ